MVSYATLIVGSLLSIFYLAFEAFKKKDNPISFEVGLTNTVATTTSTVNNYSKLSLLQTIDLWSYRIIGIGFPFLTIGIISGAVWANEAWGSYWSWDPKETWALITWLVFAIYLHSRLIKGWEGQKAAFLGSCGFFVIWICYLGVNFLGKGLHSYGWVL
jgi:cytochrome c-type biogenesis protein CcsB